jgi:SOS-response transcriptional repressor LexA
MPTDHRAKLATIKRFDQLIAYLRDEMGWPIGRDSFEEVDDLFYDFTADELGINPKTAARIQEIKRLRPLSATQPWGIFFVKFEPKKLPVVALRRILSQVALKKRTSANSADRAAWAADDLLFVSNYGEGDERQISFAHFARAQDDHDLPTLKVLGWDNRDTAMHLDAVARELSEHLAWPDDDGDVAAWRTRWRAAFTLGHREVVTTSKELSIRLAELARNIRDRIKTALAIETDKGPLTRLMKAFQEVLVHDLDADGFADMYAQTIAYGLLSARIADPHKKTADDFAAHMRTNPFLRELMETFLKVGGRRGKAGGPGIDFDELGVSEVVDLLDAANMEAVVRDFGDRNPQEDPVIHFYELFLREYDAKERIKRGVFYTPRPVVSYIVRSVDELLRTEFSLADGLADTTTWGEMATRHSDLKIPEGALPEEDFVQILDPATGTGTFLVEVIDLIHKTLVTRWKAQGHGEKKIDALWNEYVPKHLLTRLHGYELLMAPYAIAHLKIGLKLYETGYRFGSDERARVYLTNALELAPDFSGRFEFAIPALAHEAAAVNGIKRRKRFTVVIGNPPYSKISSNLTPEMRATVERYRYLDGERIKERGALQFEINLQDDYVKFFRFCEDKVSASNVGLLGLITNNGYLSTPTLRGMRDSLLETFSSIRVLDLHGHVARGETGSDGAQEENVFDIVQGVSVFLGDRSLLKNGDSAVLHAEHYGSRVRKYSFLQSHDRSSTSFTSIEPSPPFYLFVPHDADLSLEWRQFVGLAELFPRNSAGIITARDRLVIAEVKRELAERLERFSHARGAEKTICEEFGFSESKRFDIKQSQSELRKLKSFSEPIRRMLHRPFDERFVFFHRSVVWSLSRPMADQMEDGKNLALVATRQVTRPQFEHAYVTRHIIEIKACSHDRNTQIFPLFIRDSDGQLALSSGATPNLNPAVLRQFADALGLQLNTCTRELGEDNELSPLRLFHFSYAILHCPSYRERYFEFLRSDFPRLPLAGNVELFRTLAHLGGELVALHLLESPKVVQVITDFIGGRKPEVEKVSWSKNTVWLDKAQTTGFRGVSEEVWNFHIGGYQVCEKWLKDRKGRTLSKDDIAHYHRVVVALAETIRLMKEIDEVIEQHGGWPGAFQTGEAKAAPAKVLPFRPRTVEPMLADRYLTCVPLVPLNAAAGAFSDPQHIEDDSFEWVAVESRHRLRKGMFVAQVVGKSMEPAIPDGAWCLFRAPVEGTRQGKTVLVQLRDATDPETGQRYTVKRYESEKAAKGETWRHERITLKPVNPDFEPIVLTGTDEQELHVVADLVEVLAADAFAPRE